LYWDCYSDFMFRADAIIVKMGHAPYLRRKKQMTPKEIYDEVNSIWYSTCWPKLAMLGPCGPSGPKGGEDDGWTQDIGYLEGAAYLLKEIADYKRGKFDDWKED